MEVIYKIWLTIFILLVCTNNVLADTWIVGNPVSTNSGVNVVLNWSKSSNHTGGGQGYKLCWDDDNTPCQNGGNRSYTDNKPAVLANLPHCKTLRLKAEIRRRFAGVTNYADQGAVSLKTGARPGEVCQNGISVSPAPPAPNYNPEMSIQSSGVGSGSTATVTTMYSNPAVDSIRVCYKLSNAKAPHLHPKLCEYDYWLVGIEPVPQINFGADGYDDISNRKAGGLIKVSPTVPVNTFNITNLHSKCKYSFRAVFFDSAGQVLDRLDQSVYTGSSGGLFGGWSCFFNSFKTKKSSAAVIQKKPSK